MNCTDLYMRRIEWNQHDTDLYGRMFLFWTITWKKYSILSLSVMTVQWTVPILPTPERFLLYKNYKYLPMLVDIWKHSLDMQNLKHMIIVMNFP